VIGAIVSAENRQIITQQLDLTGLACPLPLLKMKLALKQLEPEQLMYVVTTDSGSWADFHKFAEITNNELVSAKKVADQYQFTIKKG
jgi:tRNA 2-thiouridine synthesizing protein A